MHRETIIRDGVAALGVLAIGLLGVNVLSEFLNLRGAAPANVVLVAQVVTGAVAACAIPNFNDAKTRGFALHLAIWLTLAGSLGVAIWTALVIADLRSRPTRLFSAEIDRAIDDDPLEALAAVAGDIHDGRIRLEGASAVRPLRDILTTAPTSVQLRALSAVARSYDPSMAHALSLALNSTDATVRVLAATVLAKLHHEYGSRIEVRAAPSTPETAAAFSELGQARLAFALSGLMNEERRTTALDQAQDAFATALSIDCTYEPARAGLLTSRRAALRRPPVVTAPRPLKLPERAIAGRL